MTGRRSRGRSSPARRPTAPTGPCRNGSASCRTTASPRPRPRRRGSCGCRTGRARSPSSPSTPTGRGTGGTTSSGRSPTRTIRCTGSARPTAGEPLDGFGRNVYIDTFDSAYGPGWRRENSALTHKDTGVFCYSVNPHPGHPAGTGSAYRITVIGPGVTPDVEWTGPPPGPYDAAADAIANAQIAALGDGVCRPN